MSYKNMVTFLRFLRKWVFTSWVRLVLLLGIIVIPLLLGTTARVAAGFSTVKFSEKPQLLAQREFSLDDRYSNKFVNDVFKDNILLTMAYLSGKVHKGGTVNWDQVRKPFTYEMELKPGQVFAFHDAVLSPFSGKVVKTSDAHFDGGEGFKSDGYLFGDGVCHLASFINWVARDAKLQVVSPTSHDFARIPDVPREYGVAIYASPSAYLASSEQNLYIEDSFDKPVTIAFRYEHDKLEISVYKATGDRG